MSITTKLQSLDSLIDTPETLGYIKRYQKFLQSLAGYIAENKEQFENYASGRQAIEELTKNSSIFTCSSKFFNERHLKKAISEAYQASGSQLQKTTQKLEAEKGSFRREVNNLLANGIKQNIEEKWTEYANAA